MSHQVLIAGGGITGLTTAYRLQERARAAGLRPRILVVEKEQRLGGKTQTEHAQGMVIEAGPDSFVSTKPWFRELCQELNLPLASTNPEVHTTYIYKAGLMQSLPAGMQLMVPTQIWPFVTTGLLSPLGKLRAALEPFVPARQTDGDESIGSFVGRRFGREVLENIAGPLMGGIYGGDWDQVSMKATFPMFMRQEREQRSLLMAAWKQKAAASRRRRSPTGFSTFLTIPTGLHTAVEALVDRSGGVEYELGTQLVQLERLASGSFRAELDSGEVLEADAVVLALPGYIAAALIRPDFQDVAELLDTIPYGSSVVVGLGYNRSEIDHPLDASGFLVPASEPLPISASTWVSSKWAHAAPPDKALLRVFLGRAGGKNWTEETDDVILRVAQDGLYKTMGLRAEPIATRIFRWPKAMAQYRVGHLEKVDRVEHLMERSPGLYLAGAAYRGVGLPDCVREGTTAAERVARHLGWPRAGQP